MNSKQTTSLKKWCELNNRYELINQWYDYKNSQLSLNINSVAPFSKIKAYWQCPAYPNHIYDTRIYQRTAQKQGCPYCSGKRVFPRFNDLASKCHDSIEEWDYGNNWDDKKKKETLPSDYTYGSHHVANFVCSKCHESYPMMIKSYYRKNRCPYCASTKIRPDKSNSFAKKCSDQLQFWDYEKNKEIRTKNHPEGVDPENISSKSNIKLFWKCGFGHKWENTAYGQNQSPGCSKCLRRKKFSTPEKAVSYYVEKMFPGEVIDNYPPDWNKKQDLDIYIPSKSIAIQYDGAHYHNLSKRDNDLKNGKEVISHGICLIRIREEGSPFIPDGSIEIRRYGANDSQSLNECIRQLLQQLSKITNNEYNFTIDFDRDFSDIANRSYTIELENSISKKRPDLVPFISNNHNQNRDVLSRLPASHNDKIWWTCPRCGNDHHLEVCSVTKKPAEKFPCVIMSNKAIIKGRNDFAHTNLAKMKDWDWVNNSANGFYPTELPAGSNKGPIHWICHKCGFPWTTEHLYERTGSQAHGCPKCFEEKRKDRSRNRGAKYTIQYLQIIRDNPGITAIEIQKKFGTSTGATKSKLGDMKDKGEISFYKIKSPKGPESFAYTITDKGASILDNLSEKEQLELSRYDLSRNKLTTNGNLPAWCVSNNRTILLDEWSSENKLGPEKYNAGDNDSIIWICHICNHVWKTSIESRTLGKHDCRKCYERRRKKIKLMCLRIIRDNPGITSPTISIELGKDPTFISNQLKQLVEKGILNRKKLNKYYFYSINEQGLQEIELFSKLGMDTGPYTLTIKND